MFDLGPGSRRHRPLSRQSLPVRPDSTIDSTFGSEDFSLDMVDLNIWEREDMARVSERSSLATNFSCIFQVDRERVNMFIHFRDNNPLVKTIWRTVHQELLTIIKNICIQVNQSLLLNDLYDRIQDYYAVTPPAWAGG